MDDLTNHPTVRVKLRLTECLKQEDSSYVVFLVGSDGPEHPGDIWEVTLRVQHYIESLGGPEAEDSSYDSEGEDEGCHQGVSRTASDTLGQEYAEYVNQTIIQDRPPGYTARVEFALKLGYTERQVQAALGRLGPNPAQNELLAELIKLGAQGPKLSVTENLESSEVAPVEPIVEDGLRQIVIDGSNVAMSHGNKEVFSCRGIRICVDWFRSRGHKEVTVFVPKWRKESPRPDNPIKDQEILSELEKERMLVFTPSRLVGGKRMVCYDDRYILKLAAEVDGVVVSNDNYRDLAQESPEYRKVIEERILMYSFVNDRFMPPDDPLGRSGPTLDNFLRIQPRKGDPPPPCPYGKKCTYGNKCKFHHPERGSLPHKSVTERLSEHAARHLQARRDPSPAMKLSGKSLSLPLSGDSNPQPRKTPLGRTRSNIPESSYGKVEDAYPKCENYQPYCIENVGYITHPPKSHSIENICGEYNMNKLPNSGYALWGHPQDQESADTANLHRKLQRQLTLNPSCDPRLYQLRRGPPPGPHRPLAPTLSSPQPYPGPWDMGLTHQHVTRIASAPDSARPWSSGPPPASSSEPHINLWPPRHAAPPLNLAQDARRRLHYHLASIFPEEQVQTAMQLYPEETNPQKICAAILNMFPKP